MPYGELEPFGREVCIWLEHRVNQELKQETASVFSQTDGKGDGGKAATIGVDGVEIMPS